MKKFLLITYSLATITLGVFSVQPVHAATVGSLFSGAQSQACQGVSLGSGNDCSGGSSGLNHILAVALDILSAIAGVAAVIMLIVGGFRYITSGGDSNSVSGAKNAILYAIIGLVIVTLAQVIVQFVLNKTS